MLGEGELSLFLLINLKPPTSMKIASRPKITARVTMAPMTPQTALLRPPFEFAGVEEPVPLEEGDE